MRMQYTADSCSGARRGTGFPKTRGPSGSNEGNIIGKKSEKSTKSAKSDVRDIILLRPQPSCTHARPVDEEGYAVLLQNTAPLPFSRTIKETDTHEKVSKSLRVGERRKILSTAAKSAASSAFPSSPFWLVAFTTVVTLGCLLPAANTADPDAPFNTDARLFAPAHDGDGATQRNRRSWWWQNTKATTTKATTTTTTTMPTTTVPEVSTCRGIFCDGKQDGPCWCDSGSCCAEDDTCRGILCDHKGDGTWKNARWFTYLKVCARNTPHQCVFSSTAPPDLFSPPLCFLCFFPSILFFCFLLSLF